MSQGKTIIVLIATLAIGFGGGFILRPVVVPPQQSVAVANPSPVAPPPIEARGTQYFRRVARFKSIDALAQFWIGVIWLPDTRRQWPRRT